MNHKELLRKLVSINSIFPNEKELVEFLEVYLKDLGFSVSRQFVSENRFNIIAEKGSGSKSLLFYGHMDTVPVYGSWNTNPFILSENEDLLYGLGVNDMKGGLVAILKAVENKNPKDYKLKIAFGVDEENISEGGHVLVNSGWCNDVAAIIVPETGTSTEPSIGPRAILLGRRGRAAYIIKVPGFSVHGASGLGVNAIEEAAKIILNIKRFHLAKHYQLPNSTLFVRSIHADPGSLSIPDYCEIVIDKHNVPPETKESVLEKIKIFIEDLYNEGTLRRVDNKKVEVELQSRKTPYLDPYITDEFNSFTMFVSRIIKQKYGKVEYRYGLSVADENIFGSVLKVPVLVIGPEGNNCHSANESVSYKSILDLSEIFSKVIDDFENYHKE